MSGPAVYHLRKFQLGVESVEGTAVAATHRLLGEANFSPKIDRFFEDTPRGVRAPYTAGGVAQSKSSEVSWSGPMTFEEILYPLNCGFGVVGVITGAGANKTHTFANDVSAAPTYKTCTAEFVIDDGSTKQFEREAAFMIIPSFSVEYAFNAPVKGSWKGVARADQTSTMTSALSPLTGREIALTNLTTFCLEDTWAALASATPKSNLIRSAKLDITGGLMPDYTMDGRTDLDFTQVTYGSITGKFTATVEHNTAGAAEYAKFRSGAIRFIRLKTLGSVVGSGNKTIQFDFAAKYDSEPTFSQANGIELLTLNMSLEYDPTSSKICDALVVNALTAFD